MAATPSEHEVYDLLILVDATASMSRYLESLRLSLPQILSISALTNCFERIGLLAYRDYSDSDILEWSGWRTTSALSTGDQPDLVSVAKTLVATGGGDYPEATKTGLARAYEVMRPEATTLILLYTDAPPHACSGEDTGYPNGKKEQTALRKKSSYSGYGPLFSDWVSAASTLANGEKKAQVISILDNNLSMVRLGWYSLLSTGTDGACLYLTNSIPRNISEVTIEILLAWMGVKKEGAGPVELRAMLTGYEGRDRDVRTLQNEAEAFAKGFLDARGNGVKLSTKLLTSSVLESDLPKKNTPLQDFSRTYKENATYRAVVSSQLREIIDRDVTAISLNPVFGSLWRTFCSDRENEQRQELLDLFGVKIAGMKDGTDKAAMKAWLEESYDYTGEVLEAIDRVPEELRFPCVCLDPTLTFAGADSEAGTDLIEDEDNRPITSFRRDELLELGRSCDWRILRRLGRILTRLTFINSAKDMQAHIAAAAEGQVIRIPMALADAKYGRKFWRVLLHIVVPGTMLASRAAALLAALTLRLGIEPLRQAAETEMLKWRDNWNDLEVPEVWSTNCLSLLLDADKAYRKRRTDLETLTLDDETGLLKDADRALFERLVEYKMLEANLKTTLSARVAWKPEKVVMPVGPLVVCEKCKLPRSVTVMGHKNVCGICTYIGEHLEDNTYSTEGIACGATAEDNSNTNIHWVECCMEQCRAQYVVYNINGLNVRPKCHYCRMSSTTAGTALKGSVAPVLECVKCTSRMIWPEEYRSEGQSRDFHCMGCLNDKKTEVTVETTANELWEQNGLDWLLTNIDGKIKQPFNSRTLFHLASNTKPLDDFAETVKILPARDVPDIKLYLRGKIIRNANDLVKELYSWVHRRRTESGTCSLCFSNIRKSDLLPACGRKGCEQQICQGCLDGWYGLNAAGKIINTAALHCPFCRRDPTMKTLARNGTGVHAVGNLKEAVAKNGEWIYAWCVKCGFAKEYMERVCAGGAPPDLQGWACEDCGVKTTMKVRDCPGCGITTEKAGGCDHICCTKCQTHWCFFCGADTSEEDIYEHMNNEHGGYYNGRDYEEDEDEDEDL